MGTPGSYTASLTVASADNTGYTGQYFTVGDRQIFYTETSSTGGALGALAGRVLDYVLIDGYGDSGDWDSADLTGKVAVCSRGETDFSAKAQNAFDAGAIAILIYNNQPGTISMDLSDYTGTAPCVSITQSDGTWMKEQAQKADGYYAGQLTVAEDVSSTVGSAPVSMSSFSSWGVPGSLPLKPEITAPGGSIYSVNGAIPGGKSYENMSGTSMAAPQMADDGLVYVPVTLSQSHNGLLDVQYDASVLTLERVATSADLTSLRREDAAVSVGFADLAGTDTPATLVFSVKDKAAETTDVTFTTTQQENKTGDPLSVRTETIRLKAHTEPTKPVTPPDTGDFTLFPLWCALVAAIPAAALILTRKKKHI